MKYLLLKHYRGGPTPAVDFPPMDQWTPEEVDAHVSSCATSPSGWRRAASSSTCRRCRPRARSSATAAQGRPPVTDGPFAETKDLIAGWYIIDVDSWDRAVELAGELSAVPGPGGEPLNEWLEVRPFLGAEAPKAAE